MEWKYSMLGIWHIGTMCGVNKGRTASIEVYGSGEAATGGFCMLNRFPKIGDKTFGHWSIDQLYCDSLEKAKTVGRHWVETGIL